MSEWRESGTRLASLAAPGAPDNSRKCGTCSGHSCRPRDWGTRGTHWLRPPSWHAQHMAPSELWHKWGPELGCLLCPHLSLGPCLTPELQTPAMGKWLWRAISRDPRSWLSSCRLTPASQTSLGSCSDPVQSCLGRVLLQSSCWLASRCLPPASSPLTAFTSL